MGPGSVSARDHSGAGPGNGHRQGVLRVRDSPARVSAPLGQFPSAGNRNICHVMVCLRSFPDLQQGHEPFRRIAVAEKVFW